MAAFSSLTDRLSNAFKHLKSKGKLSEADIDGTIREIRRALLDADVALEVVRSQGETYKFVMPSQGVIVDVSFQYKRV